MKLENAKTVYHVFVKEYDGHNKPYWCKVEADNDNLEFLSKREALAYVKSRPKQYDYDEEYPEEYMIREYRFSENIKV